MTVEQMREFVVLAEERNYMVAADMLFLTQATLSRHIMAMEEELGFSLFNRTTKKMELTAQGSRFLLYARRAARISELFQSELESARFDLTESVRVGYNAVVTFYRFTDVLTRFMAEHPNIPLTISESDANELIASVAKGGCDVAFVQENPFNRREGLTYIPFASDVMVAVLPIGHPLAGEKSIRLEQLKDEEFVTSVENKEPAIVFLTACRHAGFEPKVSHTGLVGPALFDWIGSRGCVGLEWKKPGQTHKNSKTVMVDVVPPIEAHACAVYQKSRLSAPAKKLVSYFGDHTLRASEDSHEI